MTTRFKTLEEFYKAVDGLIEQLSADGFGQEARKLDDLMNHVAWTTSSELLGELSMALQGIKGKHSLALNEEIDQCLEFALNHRKILGLDK